VLFNLKCEDDAADIVQETFSRLSLQDIAQIANVRAWLYRVANNLIVNKVAQKNIFLRFLNFNKVAENNITTLELFDKEYKLNILNKEILKLPDEQRKLILLYRDDFSYKEIAEIMNFNLNSVGKKVSRAIDKLKTMVGENNELFE